MHSIQKKYCLTLVKFPSRHLRTCSVTLVPRGVNSGERRFADRVNAEEEPPFEVPPHEMPPPVNHPRTQKDTRSVENVDPVILKYTNLLNDLAGRSGAPQEKVHITHFGSVRFDSENVPSIHGHFDNEVANSNFGFSEDPIQYQKENTENSKLEATTWQLGDTPLQKSISDFHESPTLSNSENKSVIYEDEKAFDELFCGVPENRLLPKEDKVIMENNRELNTISTKNICNTPDSDFINEHYFGINNQYIDSEYSSSSRNLNSDNPKNVDFTKTFDTQDIGSTADLNYIDQTFFKTSLDTLRDNRKPTVEYAEMEKDLERAFENMNDNEHGISNPVKEDVNQSREDNPTIMGFTNRDQTSNIALEYLGIEPSSFPPPKLGNQKMDPKKETTTVEESVPKSAYDYVLKKRKELHDSEFGFNQDGEAPGNRSYQKILSLVRERTKDAYTKQEMLTLLKSSIIYNMHDIVGLYKPYGVAMHKGTEGPYHTLTDFLPQLAEYLKADDLHIVHRLDATSTGVLLLARTPAMADTLKAMFKNQKIKKTYWAITKGIPSPLQGIIDIPIAEGTVDGKYRMVLRPDVRGFRGNQDKSHKAVTGFQVISKAYNTALVELTPQTGVKHQLRVHLGFGLSCPILGDHKYSHLKKMAPQRLPGDTLDRFKLTQSKVRNLPMFLLSRSVVIPEIMDGRNIFIKAKVPAFFNKALSTLKLNTHKNQVRYRDSKPID